MEMQNLKFTARNIAEIEDARKQSINEIILDFSLTTLVLFLKKGLDLSKAEEVYQVIDGYLQEEDEEGVGKDMSTLYWDIQEALRDQGFLSRALDLEPQRIARKTTIMQAKNRALNSTGNQESPTQSISD